MVRPSRDLGKLASEYEAELPRAFRFITRGLGTQETHSNDILSLLLFEPDYLKRLIQLGYHDAEAQMDQIDALLRYDEDTQEASFQGGRDIRALPSSDFGPSNGPRGRDCRIPADCRAGVPVSGSAGLF